MEGHQHFRLLLLSPAITFNRHFLCEVRCDQINSNNGCLCCTEKETFGVVSHCKPLADVNVC